MPRWLKLWPRYRHELWVSIGLVLIGTLRFRAHAPIGPVDTLGYPIVLLFAYLFALDAVLDWRRAKTWHLLLAVAWLIFLSWLAPTVLHESFLTRAWADR